MQLQHKYSKYRSLINYDKAYHKKPTKKELDKLLKNGERLIRADKTTLFLINKNLVEVVLTVNNGLQGNRYCDVYEIIP